MCPMGCPEADYQEHAMHCEPIYPYISRDTNILYNDIFSDDIMKQAAVTKLYSTLLERREDASALTIGPSNCPGNPGQCIDPDMCANCADV